MCAARGKPPRSAPLPGPALVTKKVILACCARKPPLMAKSAVEIRIRIEAARFTSSSRQFATNLEMRHPKTVALRQDFGDPAAVADLPVGFIAQQAARRGFGDFRGLLQRELGFGTGELLLDNPPKPIPLAALVGEPALRRCAERLEMDVAHSDFLYGGRELPLRKSGPARYRPIADINEGRYTSRCEGRNYGRHQTLPIPHPVHQPPT